MRGFLKRIFEAPPSACPDPIEAPDDRFLDEQLETARQRHIHSSQGLASAAIRDGRKALALHEVMVGVIHNIEGRRQENE